MPPYKVGISGCGPRAAAAIARFVAEMSLHPDSIPIDITVFERQPDVNLARGSAWQKGCDGAINTGVPGLPAGLDGLDPDLAHHLDLAARVQDHFVANRAALLETFKTRNPLVAILFHKAFRPDGTLDTTKAFASRGAVGEVMRECFKGVVDYVHRGKVPGLSITVHCQHEVIGTDYSDAKNPKLSVKRVGQQYPQTFAFNHVLQFGGTPLAPVVQGKSKPNTYTGPPDYDLIKAFLSSRGHLDRAGKYLLPGKHGVIAGEGLSGLDFDGIGLAFNPAFILDLDSKDGCRVDAVLAAKYPKVFTSVSSGTGRPAPPRLSHSEDWQGVENPLLNTKEMHSLRLVPGLDWASISIACLNHNIAHTLGEVPLDTHLPLENTMTYMQQYNDQAKQHLDNPTAITKIALRREGLQAFFYGRGFEADAKTAERNLDEEAPLTRRGRGGWLMVASTGHEMSKIDKQRTLENRDFFAYRDYIRFEAAASPIWIQYPTSMLYLTGIIASVSAKFSDIIDTGSAIQIGTQRYDFLLEPEGITRAADIVIASLQGQVLMDHGVPMFEKGRRYANAKEPINVIEGGAGGWGIPIRGDISGMANERWSGDTVDLGNTVQYAELVTKQLRLQIYIAMRGLKSDLDTLYQKALPSEPAFNAETEQFRAIYDCFREKYACAILAKGLAGPDKAKFRRLADQIANDATRRTFVAQYKQLVTDNMKKLMPDFVPAKRDRYEAGFFDFTKIHLAKMTQLALTEAGYTVPPNIDVAAELADALGAGFEI
jgi:hypothetical protein